MQSYTEAAVYDRRQLLRHVLQDYKDRGGQIAFPVGCSGLDDWLLDSIDVSLVLQQMNKRGKLDLILMTSTAGTLNHSIFSKLPSEQSAADAAKGPPQLLNVDPNTPAPAATSKAAPHLQLPSLAITVDERDLQTLSYQIFISVCGAAASPALVQSLRAQLEISEHLGKDLAAVAQIAQRNKISSLAKIDGLVKLLELVPPSTFQSFRSFTTWRIGISTVVSKSLEYAAARSWVGGQVSSGSDEGGAPARSLLASLRGSLRRLDVREADDYDEQEYAAAARGVVDAAGRLAANIQPSEVKLPVGVAAQIAEQLLSGVFDPLDEGQFAPEAQELLTLLSARVWPEIGISQQMHSALAMWVHFRQYTRSKEVPLLLAGSQLAQRVDFTAAGSSSSSLSSSNNSDAYPTALLEALSKEASALLSDYHSVFATTAEMQAMLGFLVAVETARGGSIPSNEGGGGSGSTSLEAVLVRCVRASVGAAFARRAAEVHTQVALEEDRTALLVTETIALLHLERSKYIPVLRRHLPASMAIIAAALHELFGAKMLSWLISVPTLTKSVADTINASVNLEGELLSEVAANGGGGTAGMPAPWSAMQRVSPLVQTWARTQVNNMHGWLDRMMTEEDWSPVVQSRGATCRSAVEILKMIDDSIATLFGMGLAVPVNVVRTLVEGLDAVLQKFCVVALSDLGTADSLIPPAPPLTRYKKDLADSAVEERMGGSHGIKSVTNKVGAVLATAWLPSITADEQHRVLDVLYDVLVVKANSLYYIANSTASIESLILEKWRAAQEEEADFTSLGGNSGGAVVPSTPGGWTVQPGFLNGALAAAKDSVEQILRFITLKLICGDLRTLIFKDLYSYDVAHARIQQVLEDVDTALGMLCEMLNSMLAPRMAGHVCKTLAAAVLHVVVDGGPNRLFYQHDAPLLFEDFENLKAMFYAEGAGLDPAAVTKLCAALELALSAMAMDTPSLIALAKNTKKEPLRASVAGPGQTVLDPDVVLRVLCHRADYEASKYLKKDHKIPKKLPNVFSASVSRSFATVFPASASKASIGGGVRRMATSP